MKIVIAMFPNVDTPEPGRLGRMIEDRGLESLWFTTFDPFVAMTAAAAATNRLKIGTGVCCAAAGTDPAAKQVATVDVPSGGRVILGVGAGWNRQEMRNHGTDPRSRMRWLTEPVQAMIEIWTQGRGRLPRPVRRLRPADGRAHGRAGRDTWGLLVENSAGKPPTMSVLWHFLCPGCRHAVNVIPCRAAGRDR